MSTFLNSWLLINALITDEANSKHCVLRESNARWMSRTNVTRFLLACFTLDLISAYDVPADDISNTRLCQNCGWYKAVLQCLQVDEAATLDSGDRWLNTWWRARLGREFQLTVSISTRTVRYTGITIRRIMVHRHLMSSIFDFDIWEYNITMYLFSNNR